MMVTRCMLSYAVIVGTRAGIASATTTTTAVQTATVNAAPMLGLTAANVNVCLNVATCTSLNTATAAAWTARGSGSTVTVSYNNYAFVPASGSIARLTSKNFSASSTEMIP